MSCATKKCVVLMSSMSSIKEQKTQMASLAQILKGNRIVFAEIDCSYEENKDLRDKYFEISGVRGNYPQVFLEDGDVITFVGTFDRIHELNELRDLPPEYLEQNAIETLSSVFADVEKTTTSPSTSSSSPSSL